MSKGSKRRRENTALVEANWDSIFGKVSKPDPVGLLCSSGMPSPFKDRPDGTRVWCDGRVETIGPARTPVPDSQMAEAQVDASIQGTAVQDVRFAGQGDRSHGC